MSHRLANKTDASSSWCMDRGIRAGFLINAAASFPLSEAVAGESGVQQGVRWRKWGGRAGGGGGGGERGGKGKMDRGSNWSVGQ